MIRTDPPCRVRPTRRRCSAILCVVVAVVATHIEGRAADSPDTAEPAAPSGPTAAEAAPSPEGSALSDTSGVPGPPAPPDPNDPLAPSPAPGGVITLDEIVVTATRSQRAAFDLPYQSSIIEAPRVRERAYRTLPQALRDVPGVMVQETSHAQGSPFIRGFTSFRTLLLIDGVRLNNSVFRPGPNQYAATIDLQSVQRLEVIKGPSSVLYGSDAIGGTVNALTIDPYAYGEGVQVGGRGFYRVASAEKSHTVRGELSLGVDGHTGAVAGGTYKQFGDLIGGDDTGRQPHTGYDEYAVDAKVEHFFHPDTRLVFLHQSVRQNNAPRTHRTVFAVPFEGSTVGSDLRRDLDQERELTYLQLHAERIEDTFFDTFRGSVSFQHQGETRDRIRGSGARDLQGFDVHTVGIWAQLESDTPIGRLTYGGEYYHDEVDSFSTRNPIQGPVGDDASYDLLGLFVQDEIALGERWRIILGGRLTYAAADADEVRDPATGGSISVSDDWSSLVGSGRVLYELVPEHLNLFGGVSQGFRAPNLSDLTRFDSARTNEFEVPATGLDPEEYVSFEVGAKARTESFRAQVAIFYTDIEDQILRFPTGTTTPAGEFIVAKANVGDGYVYGIEMGAAWRFLPELTLFGNATFIEGEVSNIVDPAGPPRDEYLSRLMPLTGQVGLRWEASNLPVWVETVVLMADDADKLSSRDAADTSRIPPGGTPSYVVWTIRAGWRPVDRVELNLALENILDEDFRVHGSGQNRPGRNLVVSVNATF